MLLQKKMFWLSAFITFFSIAMTALFHFGYQITPIISYLFNIFLAIFSGSCVTTFYSLVQYLNEKNKLLDKWWHTALNYLKLYSEARYCKSDSNSKRLDEAIKRYVEIYNRYHDDLSSLIYEFNTLSFLCDFRVSKKIKHVALLKMWIDENILDFLQDIDLSISFHISYLEGYLEGLLPLERVIEYVLEIQEAFFSIDTERPSIMIFERTSFDTDPFEDQEEYIHNSAAEHMMRSQQQLHQMIYPSIYKGLS